MNLPPILICTLPKSGSVFLAKKIGASLNLAWKYIDTADFPYSQYDSGKLFDFVNTGGIAQAHLQPSIVNIAALCLSVRKMILNIRDPRNALISWIHYMDHINRQIEGKPSSVRFSPQTAPYISASWTSSGFSEKFEICYKFFYRECIVWLIQWFKFLNIDFKRERERERERVFKIDSNYISSLFPKITKSSHHDVTVLLTTQEDMVISGEDYILTLICSFYGIPPAAYIIESVPKDMSTHFRSGRTDSWKIELSPTQQDRVTKLLPVQWCTYFGWDDTTAR